MELLLERGALTDTRNSDGNVALFCALRSGTSGLCVASPVLATSAAATKSQSLSFAVPGSVTVISYLDDDGDSEIKNSILSECRHFFNYSNCFS